jgi:hypothetical protein
VSRLPPLPDRNAGALPERIGAFVELYGFEAMALALARWCDGEAASSRGLRRELVLRRLAEALRDMGAEAREELNEGLAATDGPLSGRKFRFAPEARGAVAEEAVFAIVRAVQKGGIRKALGAPPILSDRKLQKAGGMTRYDLVEVEVLDARGRRLGTDALPPCALEYFASYR